jgi:hypothetical protein
LPLGLTYTALLGAAYEALPRGAAPEPLVAGVAAAAGVAKVEIETEKIAADETVMAPALTAADCQRGLLRKALRRRADVVI